MTAAAQTCGSRAQTARAQVLLKVTDLPMVDGRVRRWFRDRAPVRRRRREVFAASAARLRATRRTSTVGEADTV
jgi:hypothetical protein